VANRKKNPNSKSTSSRSTDPVETLVDETTAYAVAVRDGLIITGKPVRLACLRHLRDIDRQAETGLQWRPDLAQRVFDFFRDNLTIEARGEVQPFCLEPFERFIAGSIFGWLNADGTRRFRNAFVEIGKGNGKTPLAAGVGLFGLIADGEQSPEVYSAAVTADQAKILWKDASTMVQRNPEMRGIIEDRVASLFYSGNNGVYRPVSSEHRGLDGKRVHMALIDEVHEHPTSLVVEKMRAGTKTRRNALIFEITNSGSELETVCRKHHEYSLSVVEGAIEDPSWFAYVCALDDGDDWLNDESCWIKSNPGLGTILPIQYLREQVREAQGMPSKQNMVARLNFCVWTQQHTIWIPQDRWDACKEPIDYAALRGQPCWVGIDLSTKLDLTAVVLAFKHDREDIQVELSAGEAEDGGIQKKTLNLNYTVTLIPRFYIPEETMYERERQDRVPYSTWAKQGWIYPTSGNTVDYDFVLNHFFNELAPAASIQEVGYDPYNCTQVALQIQSRGYTVVEVRQGVQTMSEPAKVFEALVRSGRIRHGGHPVLAWNVSNVAVKEDKKGNIFPFKQHERKRIDGVIASIIALSRLIVAPDRAGSVYDNPEPVWLDVDN
jgi:phage terminase large subunit-like protein